MHISRITKKSKTSFPRMGRYRFTYHGKNKSSFTFHAKQKCPFTCHKKSIGDLLQSHSGLLHLVISWSWTRKSQIVQIVKYPWNFTVCCILLGKRECLTQQWTPETPVPQWLYFTKLHTGIFLVKMIHVQHRYQFSVLSILYLTSTISSMLCDENAGIQDWAFKHALSQRNRKQNAI